MNICIVTCPLNEIAQNFLSNLIEIVSSFSDNVYVITGSGLSKGSISNNKKVHLYKIKHNIYLNIFVKAIMHIFLQLKISYNVINIMKYADVYVYFFGSFLLLPILTTKLLTDKNVILLQPASNTSISKYISCKNYYFTKIMEDINYKLSDNIILYSPYLIKEWNLGKYRHKILIAHEHFLDFEAFTVTTPLSDRPQLIGYIGRLSGEKGVQHFVQALPAILGGREDLHVLIGGDGQLKESIEASLNEEGIAARVDLPGWISHNDLPMYLNQLRLLILPSYTEGLPNIMLEAMACGTPVLATPVGGIPDVIKDGETGFLMENNSPECIASNVIRALEYPDLEGVAQRARALVEREFTFERAVERWRKVLEDVCDDE